jgi:hypothetical protein
MPVQKRELGALLGEFDAASKPAVVVADGEPAQDPRADFEQRLAAHRQRLDEITPILAATLEKQAKHDEAEAVRTVKALARLNDFADDDILAGLHRYAATHPQFNSAWNSRDDDVKGWEAALKQAAGKVGKEFTALANSTKAQVEAEARQIRTELDAAFAASRNIHNGPMPSPDFDVQRAMRVSDQEYKQMVADYLAQGGR